MTIQPTHSSRRILLPVRQWFILFSLAAAFFLSASSSAFNASGGFT